MGAGAKLLTSIALLGILSLVLLPIFSDEAFGGNGNGPDISIDPGENVLSIDSFSATLHKINPTTGATISSVTITLAGTTVSGGAGLAFNPVDGKLYALLKQFKNSPADADRILVTIDPSTGIATKIGDRDGKFAALAFNPGTLFSVTTAQLGAGSPSSSPSTLHTLSTTDASATEECELANGLNEDGRALAFRLTDESLYHAFEGTLEKIGDISGATCVVTDIPLSDTSLRPTGLVFRQATNEFLLADFTFSVSDLYRISANPGTVNFVGGMSHFSRGLAIIFVDINVGGTYIPMDKTALLLAGAQSISMWMIPVVIAGVGIGVFVIIRRK